MILDHDRTNYFIQSGYARICRPHFSDFKHCNQAYAYSDWSNGANDCCHERYGPGSTSYPLTRYKTYNFKVERVYSSGSYMWHLTFNAVGGSEVRLNTVLDSRLNFHKNIALYSAETHNRETRMPGDYNTKAAFSRLRWVNGNTWYSPVLTCDNNGTSYVYYKSNCSNGSYSFAVWDSR